MRDAVVRVCRPIGNQQCRSWSKKVAPCTVYLHCAQWHQAHLPTQCSANSWPVMTSRGRGMERWQLIGWSCRWLAHGAEQRHRRAWQDERALLSVELAAGTHHTGRNCNHRIIPAANAQTHQRYILYAPLSIVIYSTFLRKMDDILSCGGAGSWHSMTDEHINIYSIQYALLIIQFTVLYKKARQHHNLSFNF